MSFDLSWLWSLLESIADTLNSWFSTIWTQAQNIVNTGQGIFSGLLAFGSQIWDAITKMATTLGEWFGEAYNYLKTGLQNMATIFGQWFNYAMTFIAQGFAWIGSQFYNIGNWVYNALYTAYNWIANTILGAWNAMVSWFSGVVSAIGSWWGTTVTGINQWWTDLLKGFRNKIVQTVTADITIAMAWKSAERILQPHSLRDIGYGAFGMIASPIVGSLVGTIIDSVVPVASSTNYPLIPSITGLSYTPPSMTIETPEEKDVPNPEVSGAPTGPFTGLSTGEAEPELDYDCNVTAGQDKDLSVELAYDVEVA